MSNNHKIQHILRNINCSSMYINVTNQLRKKQQISETDRLLFLQHHLHAVEVQ